METERKPCRIHQPITIDSFLLTCSAATFFAKTANS
jgi:hypothetical protein